MSAPRHGPLCSTAAPDTHFHVNLTVPLDSPCALLRMGDSNEHRECSERDLSCGPKHDRQVRALFAWEVPGVILVTQANPSMFLE